MVIGEMDFVGIFFYGYEMREQLKEVVFDVYGNDGVVDGKKVIEMKVVCEIEQMKVISLFFWREGVEYY